MPDWTPDPNADPTTGPPDPATQPPPKPLPTVYPWTCSYCGQTGWTRTTPSPAHFEHGHQCPGAPQTVRIHTDRPHWLRQDDPTPRPSWVVMQPHAIIDTYEELLKTHDRAEYQLQLGLMEWLADRLRRHGWTDADVNNTGGNVYCVEWRAEGLAFTLGAADWPRIGIDASTADEDFVYLTSTDIEARPYAADAHEALARIAEDTIRSVYRLIADAREEYQRTYGEPLTPTDN